MNRCNILITLLVSLLTTIAFGQDIKRIDGTKIPVDSLSAKISYLMRTANVSGVAISVFNDNRPVFGKTYGLTSLSKKSFRAMTGLQVRIRSRSQFGRLQK